MERDLQFVGMESRGRKFVSPHTRMGLTVYPQFDRALTEFCPVRNLKARYFDWDRNRSEASITRLNWSKQMGQASGRWSLQFKQKHGSGGELLLGFNDQAIGDGDWMDLSLLRNGIAVPICRGIIDSVRERRRSAGGATVSVFTVTGRDHGAFFETPITWSSLWAQTLNELVTGLFTRRIQGKVGGRPDELFAALIEGTFRGGTDQGVPSGQWVLPQSLEDALGVLRGSSRLYDLIKIVPFNYRPGVDGLRGAYYNEPGLWTVGEQPLHQTLSQWVNPLLNEWWYDLLPTEAFIPRNGLHRFLAAELSDLTAAGDPTSGDVIFKQQTYGAESGDFGTLGAMIRERPFPTTALGKDSLWFSLPTWRIPTWLIEDLELGRSGNQRFNLFELLGDFGLGPQQEQAAFSKPRWHKDGIRAHGLRPYSQSTRFFAQQKEGPGGWFRERTEWLKTLVDWYAPNPFLLQGSIRLKIAAPEIRIGHRVILDNGNPHEEIQAYVEGTTVDVNGLSQSSGVQGSTTLVLTRGFQGSDEQLMAATRQLSNLYQEVF